MPLTEKGRKIKRAMTRTYGAEKAKRIFHASINAGRITGAEKGKRNRKRSKTVYD